MSYTAWSVAQDEIPDATKWNYLGGNDAHFYSFLGDNLEWQAYTPTVSGITVGNSTTTAYYARVGNTVFVRLRFIVGSSTTMTAAATFTLPITAHADFSTQDFESGAAYIEDAGVTGYPAFVRINSTTTFYIGFHNATGTYMGNSSNTTTTPFTWATGDYMECNFFYEAAE